MSMRPSSSSRLKGLMNDAFHLRRALFQKAIDNELTANHIQIVHMVDRPVFSIFVEPDTYGLALTAFPSLYEPDLDAEAVDRINRGDGANPVDDEGRALIAPEYQPSKSLLSVNALITSEYLFRERATFGNNVLVSPAHAQELHRFAISLTRRLDDPFDDKSGRLEIIYDGLRRWLLAQLTRHDGNSDSQWLDAIREGILDQLGTLELPMVALNRLDRIYESNMLRPAVSALEFDADLVVPDPVLVGQWRVRIARAKQRHQHQPNPHALEADALTLAQLELLNRGWLDNKRLCVLVTNDRGLHRAWAAWLREPGRDSRDLVSALRDPRELLPILDPRAVAEDERKAIVEQVETALDQLLSSVATTDMREGDFDWTGADLADGLDIADSIGDRLASGDSLKAARGILRRQINAVASSWLQLLEQSVVDRAGDVASFAQDEAIMWTTALTNELTRRSRDHANDIADKFFDLATSSALLRTEVWAVAQSDRPLNSNRRRLVTSFHDFKSELFYQKPLQDLVTDLKKKVGARFEALQLADPGERLLVIGCSCLGIGAWAAARSLLDVAKSRPMSPELERETVFFSCVARRLAADPTNYRAQYSLIAGELETLNEGAVDDLDRLRSLNELVALQLCRIPFADAERPTRRGRNSARALDVWRRVTRLDDGGLLKMQTSQMSLALQKQYALNTFCLTYYLARDGELPADVKAMSLTLFGLRLEAGFEWLREGVHGEIYPIMAQFALADANDKPELARMITLAATETLKNDEQAGFLFDIPYVDKLELSLVRDAMASIAAGS